MERPPVPPKPRATIQRTPPPVGPKPRASVASDGSTSTAVRGDIDVGSPLKDVPHFDSLSQVPPPLPARDISSASPDQKPLGNVLQSPAPVLPPRTRSIEHPVIHSKDDVLAQYIPRWNLPISDLQTSKPSSEKRSPYYNAHPGDSIYPSGPGVLRSSENNANQNSSQNPYTRQSKGSSNSIEALRRTSPGRPKPGANTSDVALRRETSPSPESKVSNPKMSMIFPPCSNDQEYLDEGPTKSRSVNQRISEILTDTITSRNIGKVRDSGEKVRPPYFCDRNFVSNSQSEEIKVLTLKKSDVDIRNPENLVNDLHPTKRQPKCLLLTRKYICIADTSLSIFDAKNFQPVCKLSDKKYICACEVDDDLWAATQDGHLVIVNPLAGTIRAVYRVAHLKLITNIFTTMGFVFSLSIDGKLNIWDLTIPGRPVNTFRIVQNYNTAVYCGDYLWVAKGKQIFIYDPLQKSGALAHSNSPINVSAGQSGLIEDFTCGAGDSELMVFGHANGYISLYKHMRLVSILNVAINGITALEKTSDSIIVGTKAGRILVIASDGELATLIREWCPDNFPVLFLRHGRRILVTASKKAVQVWDRNSLASAKSASGHDKLEHGSNLQPLRVQIVSWNLDAASPSGISDDELGSFFNRFDPDILVWGFQEIVALEDKSQAAIKIVSVNEDAAKEYDDWSVALVDLLRDEYTLMANRGMVGIYSLIFVRKKHVSAVENINSSCVKTGIGGRYGNKGGVIFSFTCWNTSICFVNCHLAAGQYNVLQRNKDAEMILSQPVGPLRPLDHDVCFFFGDTNYRVNIVRQIAIRHISHGEWNKLLQLEQLHGQIGRNPNFCLGKFLEAPLAFPPTYKYDRGTGDFDTSDKQRVPAWCDRILYRGKNVSVDHYDSIVSYHSDHRPVTGVFTLKVHLHMQ